MGPGKIALVAALVLAALALEAAVLTKLVAEPLARATAALQAGGEAKGGARRPPGAAPEDGFVEEIEVVAPRGRVARRGGRDERLAAGADSDGER